MVSTISPSSFSGSFGSGPSIAGLQAQLDRCQQQLSDSINCDSAKTQEGKQNIQELSGRISEIKARIQEATLAQTDRQQATSRSIEANPGIAAAATQQGTAFGFALTGLGTRLDVFA